jgi:hypothetical protein
LDDDDNEDDEYSGYVLESEKDLKKKLKRDGKIKEKVSEQFMKGYANDNFPKKKVKNDNNNNNNKNVDINGRSYDELWEDEGPETEEYNMKKGFHSVFPEIIPEIPLKEGKRVSKLPANKLSFRSNKQEEDDLLIKKEIPKFVNNKDCKEKVQEKSDIDPSDNSWVQYYAPKNKPSFTFPTFPKAVTTTLSLISKKKTESVISIKNNSDDFYYLCIILVLLVCIGGLIYLWSIYSSKNTKLNKRSISPSPPCHSFSYENIPVTFPSKIEVQEDNICDSDKNFVKEKDTIERIPRRF